MTCKYYRVEKRMRGKWVSTGLGHRTRAAAERESAIYLRSYSPRDLRVVEGVMGPQVGKSLSLSTLMKVAP